MKLNILTIKIGLLLLCSSAIAQIPTDSLLLYYPFNGNANDQSSNTLNGTVYGATLVNDRFGNPNSAYYFDGINDYIDMPNVSLLKPDLPISFSFWAKLESLAQLDNQFFSTSPVSGNYAGCTFNTTSTGTGGLNINYGGYQGVANSTNRRTKTVASNFTTNVWYHIVGIFRGPLDMDVYINGNLISGGSYSGSGGTLQYANVAGSIGRGSPSANYYHWGTIDDFAIYNKPLTYCEVQQLYTGTPLETIDTITACDSIIWVDGNTYYTDNNTSTYTMVSSSGCDSTVTLNLNITDINTSVSQNGNQINAVQQSNATYQWVICNDPTDEIPGETSSSFTPTNAGDYAVIIEIDGCSEMSDCISIKGDTLSTQNTYLENLSVYPNPVVNLINLDFGTTIDQATIKVTSVTGQLMHIQRIQNTSQAQLSCKTYPSGIYHVSIEQNEQYVTKKIMKL